MDPRHLHNLYFALRHGQSLANVKDLIVSDPANGVTGFGLSDPGRAQAEKAFSGDAGPLGPDTLIYASDFLRAAQTAQIAARALGCHTDIVCTPLLRERFFGTWEMTSGQNYSRVWADDARQIIDPATRVEPVDQVLARGLACLEQIEARFRGRTVLLVSHGDTLQILMTFFAGWPAFRHRELPHLETAEVRPLS